MASPNTHTPYAASPLPRPVEVTIQALRQLVNFDLSKDDILLMSRLGAVGVGKILDVFQNEDRSAVDQLLGSLEGRSEDVLGSWIDELANDKERARSAVLNPPQSSIDNNIPATTATLIATHHLHLPIPLKRSASSRTRSVSSRGSSSTNITHPSNKIGKKQPVSQAPRTIFYCPDCGKEKKNAFPSHFKTHIKHLLGSDINEHVAIGCGYCPAHDLFTHDGLDGKVFHGQDNFAMHVKEAHASSRNRPHWDINASFHHILSAQQLFRRIILQNKNQGTVPHPPNCFLTLCWTPTQRNRELLRELQIVSGNIFFGQASYTDAELEDLLSRVYRAAAHNWQPFADFTAPSGPSSSDVHGMPPQLTFRSPTMRSQDADIAHVGQNFNDVPTPRYAQEMSLSVAASPRTVLPAPLQVGGTFQQGEGGVGGGGTGTGAAATFHETLPTNHLGPGTIAFPAMFAGESDTQSSMDLQDGLIGEICSEWALDPSTLFRG